MNLKHKILSKVYTLELLDLKAGVVFEDRKISYTDLLKSLNYNKDKAFQMIESLKISGDILIDPQDFVIITEKGIAKLNDKYYINNSSKRFRSKTLDWIKIITGIISLIILITSFIVGIINNHEIQQLKKNIDLLKINHTTNK